MSESVLVMVFPKAKVDARKWMSTTHGIEVKEKDKIECIATFTLHESSVKTEHIEDLESFLTKLMEDPGAIKMNNFKKIYDHSTSIKGNPKLEPKVDERK